MKKNVRLSVPHLISFLFIYIIIILMFLAFRGYFFLIMTLLFTVTAPLSFYLAWRLADHIKFDIIIEKETARQGDETEVVFSVTNQSYLCALRSTWLINTGNSFYQTSDMQKLVLSIPPRGRKQYHMLLTMTDLGRIEFVCEKFYIAELLGIFTIHASCSVEKGLFILPPQNSLAQDAFPEICAGAAELSESSRKGNDYSEVSDLRTYQPGDRPRDIHWKLSARQSELMVKERISLSGSEYVLLLDLPDDKNQAQQLLHEGYYKIKNMLDRHMAMRLLIWNNHTYIFESYSCTCVEDLETAYCEIFHTNLISHNCDRLKEYMKNCYPQLESYMCIAPQNDIVQLEICVNG